MSEPQVELTIRRQGHPDMMVPLPAGSIHIGRADDNGLVLPDIAVSRRHARLTVSPAGVLIEDVGSGNGTYFQGKPIRRRDLLDGDEILIDPFVLVFSIPSAGAEVESTESKAADSGPPPRVSGLPRLVLVHGHGLKPEYPLRDNALSIGRSEQRDVILPDPAASRSHAEIVKIGDDWLLRDFGSVNGTHVNTRRVREHVLQDGDRIRIGSTEFAFEASKAPARPRDEAAARPLPPAPPGPPAPATRPFETLIPADGAAAAPPSAPGPASFGSAAPFSPAEPTAVHRAQAPVAPPPPAPPAVHPAPPPAPLPAALAPPPAAPPALASAPGFVAPAPQSPAPPAWAPAPVQPPPMPLAPPPQGFSAAPAPYAAVPQPAPSGFAPLAPPPRPLAPPPGGASGFGQVELTVSGRTKRPKGRKLKLSSGPGGRPQGTFMERNIRRMIAGIALAAVLLFGVTWVRRSMSGIPDVTGKPGESPAPASAVAISTDSEANQAAIDQLLTQGNALFSEKRYFEAVEKYAAVQKLSPSNATATKMGYHACEFLVVQSLYTALSQRSTSIQAAQQSYQAAMAQATEALEGRGNASAALASLEQLSPSFPTDQPLQDAISRLRSRMAGAASAAKARAREAHQATISDLFAAAQADRARGDSKSAIDGFERVLAADPGKQSELYWKAEEQIAQIKSELSARGREAYRNGLAAAKTGDYLAARTAFRETMRLDPFNQVAQRRLEEVQEKLDQLAQKFWSEAEIYEKTNQLEMAIGRYRKVMEYSASASSPLAAKAKAKIDGLMR